MKRLAGAMLLLAAWTACAEPVRVAIIGDSTVCDYPPASPCRGWGAYIEQAFPTGTVRVTNLAATGKSTKSFIAIGRWQRTLETKPDVVLIQFGHNDSHGAGRPESTDAATDYRDCLRRYIDDARATGATPVLVTPMHRRTFDRDGKLTDILRPYADAMKVVAAERQVACIDLHAASGALFARMGEAACRGFDSEPGDRTHFNEQGARAMAAFVLKELPKACPRLGPLLSARKEEIP